jgi:hypothetical protein
MNSCAASYCTCFPKVSCASGTSAPSPTAGAPRSYHFAFICSVQYRRQNKTFQVAKPQVLCGYAQNAVGRWCSSKDSPLPKSNFVLLPPWSPRPHETTLDHNKSLRVSARSVSPRLPFRKPRPSTFSTLVLVPVFRFHNLFNSPGLLPCSARQPRRVSTPHLPSIEFA